MSKHALKMVSDGMEALGLAYGFGGFSGEPINEEYWVGEYTETESLTESGLQEATFLLTGFSRSSWLALENSKEKIENYFNRIGGKTVIADNGSAVAIFYANALIVPTGDAELKRIQINLTIKEWKVN